MLKLAPALTVLAVAMALTAGVATADPISYKPGQTVAARLNASWYLATIDARNRDRFEVTFGNDTEGTVRIHDLRPMAEAGELVVGDRVLALRGRAQLFPGTIRARERKGFTIAWDDGAVPSLVKHGRIARLASTSVTPPGALRVGDPVAARWGAWWSISRIDAISNGTYEVTFGDRTSGKVQARDLRRLARPRELAVGDHVVAVAEGQPYMMPGTILAVTARGYTIEWDDDTEPSTVVAHRVAKLGVVAPPPGVPSAPAVTNWSGRPAVIKQCGATFDGAENESACLDAVTRSRFDPTTVISQCDAHMDGDDNELACVRIGMRAAFDPSAALVRCEAAMDGDESELACFGHAVLARYPAGAMIDECEAAMDGDENELACVAACVQAARDPSATVKTCEASMDGDDSELACIKRGVGAR